LEDAHLKYPLEIYTRDIHAYWIRAYPIHAYEIHAYAMDAHEMHAREMQPIRYIPMACTLMACTPEITTLAFPQGILKSLCLSFTISHLAGEVLGGIRCVLWWPRMV